MRVEHFLFPFELPAPAGPHLQQREEPDWYRPLMPRAERERLGRRTECWEHHKESQGLIGQFLALPGRGVKQTG